MRKWRVVGLNYKASIIVPVYNAEKTLVRCVESLLYGQERDIEVILIDDCSCDSSWVICQKLQEQYSNVVAIKNNCNRGVSWTRNQGLKYVTGKYVLFVDSDDWCSEWFVTKLLTAAEQNPKRLVMCGFHFLDDINNSRTDYLWQNSQMSDSFVDPEQYFELVSKVIIQFVWNKIFSIDIIRKQNLCFDEKQTMGEDFQFVLDYMSSMQPEGCIILNQPLYYYVRMNSSSLMSKFGLIEREQEFKRYYQCWGLTGDRNKTKSQYEKILAEAKMTQIYQAMHSQMNRIKKIEFIESVMKDGKAIEYYRQQNIILQKERLVRRIQEVKNIWRRIDGKFRRGKRDRLAQKMKKQLEVEKFTVISQNCIGGVFYHDMEMQFLSPTINLFFGAEDFVRFVLDLKKYLDMELEMSWEETYPIGRLGDIKINFMHYNTCTEAKEKWEKRKHRIQWKKVIVVSTDREKFDDEVYQKWKQIQYPKVLFTTQERFAEDSNAVFFTKYEKEDFVPDLIPDRDFYKKGILIKLVNSL